MEKHDELIEALGALTHDPLAFVYFAYPWGEPGTPLEDMEGPDEWQIQILKDIGEQLKKGKDLQTAIQEAVASGHGIGKSALISWLIHFAISTHENTRGVVTANTEGQLRTKTWPELSKWHNMFIAKDLFTYTATAIFSSDKNYEKTWRIDAIPWSKNSPESFAGLHNQGNRILVLFDEAYSTKRLMRQLVSLPTERRSLQTSLPISLSVQVTLLSMHCASMQASITFSTSRQLPINTVRINSNAVRWNGMQALNLMQQRPLRLVLAGRTQAMD